MTIRVKRSNSSIITSRSQVPICSLNISKLHLLTCSILAGSVGWAPSFLLKRDVPHEPFIADSVDFVVSQVKSQKLK